MRALCACGVLTLAALTACGSGADGASAPSDDVGDVGDGFALDLPPLDEAIAQPDARLGGDAGTEDVSDVRVIPDAPTFRAPDNQWTWVDVPGSACANGRPTGFGVNLRAGSRDVLIFLQGGGACWDGLTCWGPVSTSFYVATGYGRVAFDTDVTRAAMLFMRRESVNPFREFNLVYVPYCTGDVHAGNRVITYDFLGRRETHHVGARNLSLFLPRIVASLPDVRRVFLAGDSAGGFGAAFSLARVQGAFPWLRVSVVDDSGPPVQPAGDRWTTWSTNWGVEAPADCPACTTSVDAFVDYYRTRFADNRFAVLQYENDAIIRTFMGLSTQDFGLAVRALADRADRTWPSARYFITPGISHVLQAQPVRPQGFDAWVRRFVDEDPGLQSVRP